MNIETFKAMVVRETDDGSFIREITQKNLSDLPPGDLLVKVDYSSLNYKDALSASGNKGVTKNYPHTPGIDAAGVVVQSVGGEFTPGDRVLVTGFDLGANLSGGYGKYIRVPTSWALRLPDNITLKESMIYGTAGFTAAYSLLKMEQHGLKPEGGEILVTGATGGVGSIAVGILAKLGYQVVAATGKPSQREFLTRLGAGDVIPREDINDDSGSPLLKGRWAGVVDTLGGNILATAIKSTKPRGVVTCCGLVVSADLPTTMFPFILRGVSLLGIDSAQCPLDIRKKIWQGISQQWKLDELDYLASECSLEELENKIDLMLRGELKGRVVVNHNDLEGEID